MNKIKSTLTVILLFLIVYTRFVNIGWGLPYPFHPDERNMADAVQNLKCNFSLTGFQFSDCLNPHFFAYGQFPLYLAYGLIRIYHWLSNINLAASFTEAALALRLISAIASLINVYILVRIVGLVASDERKRRLASFATLLIAGISPYFIQFSHFGTTESFLMLLYSLIIYFCLLYLNKKLLTSNFLLLTSLFSGLAIATKVSSLVFIAVPVLTLIFVNRNGSGLLATFFTLVKFAALVMVFSVILSPYNIIALNDFLGSMNYESAVALGQYLVFYTRQFSGSRPVIFQLEKIFPYVLGWPQYILAIAGFFFLSWKNRTYNLLRLALVIFFLPTSFIFAKWTRFVSPIFPLMTIIAVSILIKTALKIEERIKKPGISILLILLSSFFILLPGLAYLSVYTSNDVRFKASDWIYKNIPQSSYILSETANVVDIPIPRPGTEAPATNYNYISYDFYQLDENPNSAAELNSHLNLAGYIFVPSRRLFANHTCEEIQNSKLKIQNYAYGNTHCEDLKRNYPLLNEYYQRLFSGDLGFEKVAEFSSYPKIELLGKTLMEFPDEDAEETWTVFDHPVIRIYKKLEVRSQNLDINNPFPNYQITDFKILNSNFKLLVADTPEKWEKGLMYVRTRQDIDGLDGMLFVFPDSQYRTFWNRNTLADLDLLWINNDKLIGTSNLPSIEKSKTVVLEKSPGPVNKVIELIK